MRIQSTFAGLLNRLAVIYRGEPFELLPSVQPVSIIDQDQPIQAVSSPPLLDVPATAGDQVAPLAGTVLADSGALAAGDFDFTVQLASNDNNNYEIQRRDAANAANIWAMRVRLDAGNNNQTHSFRGRLALNERIRVVILLNGTAGTTHRANIWTTV